MTDDASRTAVFLLAAALVVAPLAAAAPPTVAAAYGAQDDETLAPGGDENASIQPGEKLSGAVNVQRAELEGEVDERAFGVKVARANSDAAKADVVAEQLDDVEGRIAELEQRKQHLRAARANGSISEGAYRAETAEVAAEIETARRLANATESTVRGLPADVLAERGIDAGAIQALQGHAGNLSGPEVGEIARSVAGPDVGRSMAGDRKRPVADEPGAGGTPSGGGPPNAPNGTDPGPPGRDDGADGSDDGS